MSINEDRQRYLAAAHGMQSGVAMKMNYDTKETEPKHLRVGVNSAMSDQGGLAKLLISKGLITEEEYYAAMADAMERERDTYQAWLQERIAPGGDNIRLAPRRGRTMADPVRKIVNAVIRNLEDRSGFEVAWWMDVDAKTRTEIRKSLAEDVRKVLVRDERARQRAAEDEVVDIGNGDEPPPSAAAIASVLAITDGPARPEVAVEFIDEDEVPRG